VGSHDIGVAVAVEVADSGVAGGPFRIAVGAADFEVTLAVVEEDEL